MVIRPSRIVTTRRSSCFPYGYMRTKDGPFSSIRDDWHSICPQARFYSLPFGLIYGVNLPPIILLFFWMIWYGYCQLLSLGPNLSQYSWQALSLTCRTKPCGLCQPWLLIHPGVYRRFCVRTRLSLIHLVHFGYSDEDPPVSAFNARPGCRVNTGGSPPLIDISRSVPNPCVSPRSLSFWHRRSWRPFGASLF